MIEEYPVYSVTEKHVAEAAEIVDIMIRGARESLRKERTAEVERNARNLPQAIMMSNNNIYECVGDIATVLACAPDEDYVKQGIERAMDYYSGERKVSLPYGAGDFLRTMHMLHRERSQGPHIFRDIAHGMFTLVLTAHVCRQGHTFKVKEDYSREFMCLPDSCVSYADIFRVTDTFID